MKPALFTSAILLVYGFSVCASGHASEADFVDREVLRRGAAPMPVVKSGILAAGYLEYADTPGEAATRLLADEQAGDFDAVTAAAVLKAIEEYQQLDSYGRAKFITDALWTRWSIGRYNEFWLEQAARMLVRNEPGQAERALRHLRKPWSDTVAKRRYSLWGRLYFARRDYKNAVIALEKQVAVAGDGLFDHYNLGLALLETGDRGRALALLDDIGVLPVETDAHRALRDQANLAMGWYWLASDQGGTARAFFRRVRLEGPNSNMALLGLGWSELTADGVPQRARFKRRVLCEKPEVPPDALMRLLSDRYAACRPGEKSGVFDITHDFAFDTAEHGSGRYLEALRPWQVLARRDAHDPAVQEALLASGYAHQRRNDPAAAEQAYRFAIKRYEEESARLVALEKLLRQPEMDPVAIVRSRARPNEFAAVRGSTRFQNALAGRVMLQQALREVDGAGSRLEKLNAEGVADSGQLARVRGRERQLHAAIVATQAELNQALQAWLMNDLVERRDRLIQYHSNASLALAQMYDKRHKP